MILRSECLLLWRAFVLSLAACLIGGIFAAWWYEAHWIWYGGALALSPIAGFFITMLVAGLHPPWR